jgi:hypothetical protein
MNGAYASIIRPRRCRDTHLICSRVFRFCPRGHLDTHSGSDTAPGAHATRAVHQSGRLDESDRQASGIGRDHKPLLLASLPPLIPLNANLVPHEAIVPGAISAAAMSATPTASPTLGASLLSMTLELDT